MLALILIYIILLIYIVEESANWRAANPDFIFTC
jgi:hypothetical protein